MTDPAQINLDRARADDLAEEIIRLRIERDEARKQVARLAVDLGALNVTILAIRTSFAGFKGILQPAWDRLCAEHDRVNGQTDRAWIERMATGMSHDLIRKAKHGKPVQQRDFSSPDGSQAPGVGVREQDGAR